MNKCKPSNAWWLATGKHCQSRSGSWLSLDRRGAHRGMDVGRMLRRIKRVHGGFPSEIFTFVSLFNFLACASGAIIPISSCRWKRSSCGDAL